MHVDVDVGGVDVCVGARILMRLQIRGWSRCGYEDGCECGSTAKMPKWHTSEPVVKKSTQWALLRGKIIAASIATKPYGDKGCSGSTKEEGHRIGGWHLKEPSGAWHHAT